MDSVAGSLDRLGVDHIDLYQIHHQDPLTPEEETLRALDDLVSQRLVRYIGCSNWPAWQIAKALGVSAHHGWAKFDTVQAGQERLRHTGSNSRSKMERRIARVLSAIGGPVTTSRRIRPSSHASPRRTLSADPGCGGILES